MIQAADGGSLLRDAHRWQVYNLTKNLMTDVSTYLNFIKLKYFMLFSKDINRIYTE
jgi:hypothetical protein